MESWMSTTQYAPYLGLAGFLVALGIYFNLRRLPVGTSVMKDISDQIHDGAMAFLKKEYSYLAVFIVAVFLLLFNFLNPHPEHSKACNRQPHYGSTTKSHTKCGPRTTRCGGLGSSDIGPCCGFHPNKTCTHGTGSTKNK